MPKKIKIGLKENYNLLIGNISSLLESARRTSTRAVNTILTATYWEIGKRIVEYEQSGEERAEYAHQLLKNLSYDLTKNFGRGFSADNLESMRLFYLTYSSIEISETVSRKFDLEKSETSSRKLNGEFINRRFPLPWSHYVMLVRRIKDDEARKFYEAEALRSGWSVRQLDRQISSQFYERTLISRNKSTMLKAFSSFHFFCNRLFICLKVENVNPTFFLLLICTHSISFHYSLKLKVDSSLLLRSKALAFSIPNSARGRKTCGSNPFLPN